MRIMPTNEVWNPAVMRQVQQEMEKTPQFDWRNVDCPGEGKDWLVGWNLGFGENELLDYSQRVIYLMWLGTLTALQAATA